MDPVIKALVRKRELHRTLIRYYFLFYCGFIALDKAEGVLLFLFVGYEIISDFDDRKRLYIAAAASLTAKVALILCPVQLTYLLAFLYLVDTALKACLLVLVIRAFLPTYDRRGYKLWGIVWIVYIVLQIYLAVLNVNALLNPEFSIEVINPVLHYALVSVLVLISLFGTIAFLIDRWKFWTRLLTEPQ